MRDVAAKARDEAADARDRAAAALERARNTRVAPRRRLGACGCRPSASGRRPVRGSSGSRAGRARSRAGAGRSHNAHLDDLTGVQRRGAGSAAIKQEMDRALRSDGRLVMAFVDVDGLKSVTTAKATPPGMPCCEPSPPRSRQTFARTIRSCGSGADEFVCALSETDLDAARRRFEDIAETLAESAQSGSISVGLAQLRPDDFPRGARRPRRRGSKVVKGHQ